jgi:nicotinate dehydrogenase subunit B
VNRRADQARTRADFHAAPGVLLVVRQPPPAPPPVPGQPPQVAARADEGVEILLALWDDGSATALHGHVDLGTGLRTALAQIVAEELDLPLERLTMVLGDTARAPNQGATIASASIQVHAAPLRQAAAQARAWLLAQAAEQWQLPVEALAVRDGVVVPAAGEHGAGPADGAAAAALAGVPYADLVRNHHVQLMLDPQARVKTPEQYRVVGTPVPRLDIPAKATGERVFVHDMRVPGMLHGRVVRPPYAGADHGDFIGNTLEAVDEASIAHLPGVRAVVVIRDFVGVVCEREEQAERAARELHVRWRAWPGLPDLDDLATALRNNPSAQRRLVDDGNVDQAIAGAARTLQGTYVWPYQMHASIGPSCALAQWGGDKLTVWAGTQNPHVLRADLARLTGLPEPAVDVIRMEAAGCYGRNGADDVAADAALLSRAVNAPVRVQLTREQENAWEPKGAAQLMEVRSALGADGGIAAYDFQTSYPSNGAPTLALLLTRTIEPIAQAFEMGDRTARPPYQVPHLRVSVNDMAPILRASWLRGVSALPNTFAHESHVDELASAAGADPVAFRLRHLHDARAAELVAATAQRAGWMPHTQPQQQGAHGDWLRGQGFAYARYVHSRWPGYGAAWAAWVADVDVHRVTGEVQVRRVVVGHDAGLLINPAGVQHQIHGNVLQTTSRALKEAVQVHPQRGVQSLEWGSYPLLSFREVPVIEVMHMPRPGEPPLGAGESSSVPGTAAIANAIFDATGVRFRQPPFTPEVVRAALHPLAAGPEAESGAGTRPPTRMPPAGARWPQGRSAWARTAALAAGLLGLGAALLGWRSTIAPVARPDASIYTAATLERGRLLAATGDCAVCHTAPGGTAYAGGRPMDTPFGTIHSTNITPDPDTGIGRWSFSAFQRAMREGLARDGRHLYPAFPYTAFARMDDADLMALYAYLMAQPAVQAATPPNTLRFPFNLRPLMAGWNALFHDPVPYRADPGQSAEWNRGAYLVEGVGHCGACHTPRNALGAERRGPQAHLAGAMVEGWEAPALTALSRAPLPWSANELFRYLRHGHSAEHGIAAGPMAPVVRELAALPDADLRAMAAYLASFQAASSTATPTAQQLVAQARSRAATLTGEGQRLFSGACSACHHDGDGPRLLGLNLPLALNTKLHAEQPHNLVRTILDGIREPAAPGIGFMPGFRDSLNDRQVAELVRYMRRRYAPDQPAWRDVEATVTQLRTMGR